MEAVMHLLNTAIIRCSAWFVNLFNASGITEIYLANLFIFFLIRFTLAPIFGSSKGSDKARPTGNGDSDE